MIVPLHWAHTAGAAGWGAQGAKMEPVKSRMTAAKPAAFTQPSSSFGSTLNSFLLILLSLSLFSYFLFHKSLSAPHPPNSPQTFKSGLMFEGDELLSSAVWVGWQGSSLCREEPEAIGVHGHVHGRRQRLNFTAQDSPTLKWRELNGLKMGMTTPSDYTRLRAYLRILAASVDHSLQNKPGFLPTDIYTRHCEQM